MGYSLLATNLEEKWPDPLAGGSLLWESARTPELINCFRAGLGECSHGSILRHMGELAAFSRVLCDKSGRETSEGKQSQSMTGISKDEEVTSSRLG